MKKMGEKIVNQISDLSIINNSNEEAISDLTTMKIETQTNNVRE